MSAGAALVSCLCVTRSRPALLARALRCFSRQTYPACELVIVFESDDALTAAHLAREGIAVRAPGSSADPDVPRVRGICVAASPKLPLGELRNIAVAHARGTYVCNWDDDDWSADQRIARQVEVATESGRAACTLSRCVIVDTSAERGVMSRARMCGLEGTLLCRRCDMPRYPGMARGEDTPVVDSLFRRGMIELCHDSDLYVYVYHGGNTWDARHFGSLFQRGTYMSPGSVREVMRRIEQQASPYPAREH